VDDNVQSFKAFTQVAPPASVEESVDRWQHLSPQQQESFKLLNIKNTDHVNALKSVRYTAHQLFMREYLQQSWGDPAKKQWTLAMRMADAGNRWRSLSAAEVNDYQRRADLIKLVNSCVAPCAF
jgi:hypothetical protein